MKKILFTTAISLVLMSQVAQAQPAPTPPAAPTAPAASADAPAAPAAGQDADYNARVEAAKAYLAVMKPEKIVGQMLDQVAKNPQAHMSAADVEDIRSSIDVGALEKASLDALVKVFTLDELKLMGQFYGSPTGQAIVGKMPEYMQEVSPAIQMQMQKALIAHMQKVMKKPDASGQGQAQGQGSSSNAPAAPFATPPAGSPSDAPPAAPTQH